MEDAAAAGGVFAGSASEDGSHVLLSDEDAAAAVGARWALHQYCHFKKVL